MILHTVLYLLWQNINRNLYLHQTTHTSPSRPSYGVSIVRNLEKTDHVITAPHCSCSFFMENEDHFTILLMAWQHKEPRHPTLSSHGIDLVHLQNVFYFNHIPLHELVLSTQYKPELTQCWPGYGTLIFFFFKVHYQILTWFTGQLTYKEEHTCLFNTVHAMPADDLAM